MRKILFIIRDFKQGGIPRCLQSLLPCLDNERFDVDLLCLHQDGPYKNKIKNCNIINQDRVLYHLLAFSKNVGLLRDFWTFSYKLYDRVLKITTQKSLLLRRIDLIGKRLSGKYDVVIAYSEGIAAQMASKISCGRKLVWIHNDYSFDCARGDSGTSFDSFDKIVCVSYATQRSFVGVFPQFKEKTCTIYNIINDKFILDSAKEGTVEISKNYFNIISVGRICYQKNFIIIPKILSSVRNRVGDVVKWYICGSGPEDEVLLLKQEINKYNLSDYCILLGAKDNPYPYISEADLFVMTSHYESYPTVINEAMVLGTPIISIDIPSAYEMLDKSRVHPLKEIPNAIGNEIQAPKRPIVWKGAEKHNKGVISEVEKLLND